LAIPSLLTEEEAITYSHSLIQPLFTPKILASVRILNKTLKSAAINKISPSDDVALIESFKSLNVSSPSTATAGQSPQSIKTTRNEITSPNPATPKEKFSFSNLNVSTEKKSRLSEVMSPSSAARTFKLPIISIVLVDEVQCSTRRLCA